MPWFIYKKLELKFYGYVKNLTEDHIDECKHAIEQKIPVESTHF